MFIIEIFCAAVAVALMLMLYGELRRMDRAECEMPVNAPEFDEDGFEIGPPLFAGNELETLRDALADAEAENAELRRIVRQYHKLKGKGKKD